MHVHETIYTVYLMVIFIWWFGKSHNDHQIKFMPFIEPFILRVLVSFHIVKKLSIKYSTNSII